MTLDRLFGRKEQMKIINREYKKTLHGNKTIVFVEGHSGFGKTVFIDKASEKMMTVGFYAKGRYEQIKTREPYIAFTTIFNEIARQIMRKENVEFWKKTITEALGINSDFVTAIAPEFNLLLEKQDIHKNILKTCDKQIFYVIIKKFVEVLTVKGTPVILFFDDLQWADSESIQLLEYLMGHIKNYPVMLICSYRKEEINRNHPLKLAKNNLENKIVTIELGALNFEDGKKLMKVSFRKDIENRDEFEKLIYEITGGSPLYLTGLIRMIKRSGILKKNQKTNIWTWKKHDIEKLSINKDVSEFFENIFLNLSKKEQDILKNAACIGNSFDRNMLGTVFSNRGIKRDITALAKKGAIEKITEDRYCFFHDKLYEAVIKEMQLKEKQQINAKIAKYIAENTDKLPTDYYNIGEKEIRGQDEKLKIVQYNLLSGEKAMQSVAYISALYYFDKGLSMLSNNDWETNYELVKKVYMGKAKCEYLLGRFEANKEIFDILEQNVKGIYEKIEIIIYKVIMYSGKEDHDKAISIGIDGLKLLGENISVNPSLIDFSQEQEQIEKILQNKNILDYINYKEVDDTRIKLIIKLMVLINTSANVVNPSLFMYICIKTTNLSMQYGNADFSPIAYAGYAAYLTCNQKNHKDAAEFEKLAVKTAYKNGNTSVICITLFVIASFSSHWHNHISKGIEYLERAIEYGMKAGEILFTGYCYSLLCRQKFIAGVHLKETEILCKRYREYSKTYGQKSLNKRIDLYEKHLNHLGYSKIVGKDEPVLAESTEYFYRYLYIQYYYLIGEYEKAQMMFKETSDYLKNEIGYMVFEEYIFYETLIMTAMYTQRQGECQRKPIDILNQNISRFSEWKTNCSHNFEHKYYLLLAEKEKIKENIGSAMMYYDKAIDGAMKNGFTQDAAIANELAGKFYLKTGHKKIAKLYLNEAYICYSVWGAYKKAKQIHENYSDLIVPIGLNKCYKQLKELQEKINLKQRMDRIIVGEEPAEKIKKFMKLVLSYSGAERCFLILKKADILYIKVQKNNNNQELENCDFLLDNRLDIYSSMIRQVLRTEQSLIYTDVDSLCDLKSEDYIKTYSPKMLWCIPLSYKNIDYGVLYLENREHRVLVTNTTINTVNFICTQLDYILDFLKQNTLQIKMPDNIKLSKRQMEILVLMAAGANNNEIVDTLGLTLNTVKAYAKHLYKKLNVSTRTQAVEKAKELKIIL